MTLAFHQCECLALKTKWLPVRFGTTALIPNVVTAHHCFCTVTELQVSIWWKDKCHLPLLENRFVLVNSWKEYLETIGLFILFKLFKVFMLWKLLSQVLWKFRINVRSHKYKKTAIIITRLIQLTDQTIKYSRQKCN